MADIGSSVATRLGLAATPAGALRRPLSAASPALLYGAAAEERVVLDVGSHTLRAGFSGDSAPLHCAALFGEFCAAGPSGRRVGRARGLLGADGPDVDDETLDALLLEQIREAYRTHLLLDPKARKVAVAESPLLPLRVKQALCRVLLGSLRVPLVSFYPSSLAGLVTCGAMAGLVVDCGHRSSAVVPVYDGRPLNAYMACVPMGGRALLEGLRALLRQFAVFRPFSGAQGDHPPDDRTLDEDTCARVLRDLCSIAPRPAPADRAGSAPGGLGPAPGRVEWFRSNCDAPEQTVRLAAVSPAHGRGVLLIPAWVLERAAEPLLAGDPAEDRLGLVDAVVQCIERVPVDTRRHLVSRILVVGGVADMPGLCARLLADLTARLRQSPRWHALAADVALAASHAGQDGAVFRASERPWIGVSLAVAAKIGGADVKRDDFIADGAVPDWTRLAQ
ncbi:hypothetical protein H4R18_003756 [Coemansia javaensis]|uniref:Uncharacterized protein n=1 Tax=Coemansia javaensis TaxID=2761396 RepID=A0A9W8LGS8_9FUNG|nr:hypothetical protein H4R18_003756 [Coemansia javaensis]